ncbi:MAG: hypothetical protein ABII00_02840 [Elusimicrobiota bacterium]
MTKRRLSKQQKKLVRARLRNPTASLTEIGIQAAYKQPRQSAYRALRNPHVQAELRAMMATRPKLRDERLLEKLEQGLEAKEMKFFQRAGKVTETREVVAWGERRAHLELALKLKGHWRGDTEPPAPEASAAVLVQIIKEESAKRGLPV